MRTIAIIGGKQCQSTKEALENIYRNFSTLIKDRCTEIIVDCDCDSLYSDKYNIAIVFDLANVSTKTLSILKNSDCILLNSDIKNINKLNTNIGKKIITFGLNSKATITTSSISKGETKKIVYCIQRELSTFSGNKLIQQEFSIETKTPDTDIYSLLAITTTLLLDDFQSLTQILCV